MTDLKSNLCNLLKKSEILINSNRHLLSKVPLVHGFHKRRTKIESNSHFLSFLYAETISEIQNLESYSILKNSFDQDDVLKDATKRAGYWGTLECFLQDTLRECVTIKRKKVTIDTDCAVNSLHGLRNKLSASKVNFTSTARLLGIKLQCKEIILPDGMSLYRLTKKESAVRDILSTKFLSELQRFELESQRTELRLNFAHPVKKSKESAFFDTRNDAQNIINKHFRNLLNGILFVKDGKVILGPRFVKDDSPVGGTIGMGEYPSHMPVINVVISTKDVQNIITAYELISGKSKKLDKIISRALHRFMLGRVRSDFVDKLIDYVIAWESITLTQKGNPTFQELIYRFSLNASSLIATLNNNKKRKDYFSAMKSIYSLRSCIVHGADDKKIKSVLIGGGFKDFNDACIYLETNFRKVIWWLINIDIKQRPYTKNEGWEDLLWP